MNLSKVIRSHLAAGICLAVIASPVWSQAYDADDIGARVMEIEDQIIEWRRHFHQHPELSYQEHETAAYIAEALSQMPGIEIETGIAQTGIKAVLTGGKPGPVVALRADMDALPVEERNDLPFRSTAKAEWRGQEVHVSHACGHDAHMAMLLGAAKILSDMREDIPGTVVFLFQPAEEQGPGPVPSGAAAMVSEGVLDNPKVDVVMGQHIFAGAPSGQINYRYGSLMASGDAFSITVEGVGGHGASPWTAKDPILVASQIALSLQNIVSHQVDPMDGGPTVVTIGSFNSGNRPNVIPETAELTGTIRSLSPENQRIAHESLKMKAEHIAASAGLTATVKIDTGYEVLISDPEATRSIVPALHDASRNGEAVEIQPTMTSEDFGAFGADIPVVFWHLQASPYEDRDGAPNHSSEFQIDEAAMAVGTRAFVGATLAYMDAHPQE